MSFRLAITSVAAVLASLAGMTPAVTAQDEPRVEATDLGAGVYMLSTSTFVGNLALLVGDDGAVLVDDQLPNTGSVIEGAVVELAGEGAPRFIVNTHYHGDHTGGNAHFAAMGSTVAAHHNIRSRLENDPEDWAQSGALPILTFGDDLTFHMNGQTVEVSHVPTAHTDGDAIVHFRQADIIHMGDIFFNGMFPYIDLDAGGTVDGFIAGMERGVELAGEETQIIPGHGPMATRDDLQAAIDMLREAAFRVRTLVEGGADLDAVMAAEPLSDFHDDWNWRFITTERMVTTLYNDAVEE